MLFSTFFAGQVGGTILNLSFSLNFFGGTPPSYLKVMGWGGVVAYEILVSTQGPLVLVLGLNGLGLRVWGQGLTI